MDVSGEQHINLEHNIFKRRLDLKGNPISEAHKEVVGAIAKVSNTSSQVGANTTCGSCYGAETAEKKCCNTCDEVRDAYRVKTWKFDPRGIEQCRDGLSSELEERALKEGCQIYGYLEVNRYSSILCFKTSLLLNVIEFTGWAGHSTLHPAKASLSITFMCTTSILSLQLTLTFPTKSTTYLLASKWKAIPNLPVGTPLMVWRG